MCISPDELSTKELEAEIAALYRWAEGERSHYLAKRFQARAEELEKVLKERAEEGTI